MSALTIVFGILYLYPDFIISIFNRKGLQVIALEVEAASAFQIEAPAVPVASQNAVSYPASRQRITHVGALIVSGIDFAIDVEEGNTAAFSQANSFGFPFGNLA